MAGFKQQSSKGDNKRSPVVFVFYTFTDTDAPASWRYAKLPPGWRWIGSGSISSMNDKHLLYEREEQFDGPKEAQRKLKDYLQLFFSKLVAKGFIKRFKIRYSYKP